MNSKSVVNSLKAIFSVSAVATGGYLWWRGRQIRLGQALVGVGTLSALFFAATGGTSAKTKPKVKQVDPEVQSLIERFRKAEDYALHHHVCAESAKNIDNASWKETMKALVEEVPELPAWLLGREGVEIAQKYFENDEIKNSYNHLPEREGWPNMITERLFPGETKQRMTLEQLYPFLPDPDALQSTIKYYAKECFFDTFILNHLENGDEMREIFVEDMEWLRENNPIQHEPCLESLIDNPPYLFLNSTPEHAAVAKKCVEELEHQLAPYAGNWPRKEAIKNHDHWFNASLIYSFLHDEWTKDELATIANEVSALSFSCLNQEQQGWVLGAVEKHKQDDLKKVL